MLLNDTELYMHTYTYVLLEQKPLIIYLQTPSPPPPLPSGNVGGSKGTKEEIKARIAAIKAGSDPKAAAAAAVAAAKEGQAKSTKVEKTFQQKLAGKM